MIQSVVFDLDGTLLDTLTDLADSCNYALEQLGLPTHPVDSYKYFIGDGKGPLIRRALGEYMTQERYDQACDIYTQRYAAHGSDATLPYPGILDMLDRLKAAGIACAVVSNKPHQFCQPLVPHYFGNRLSPILGTVDGIPPKPAPDRVLQAMEEMGADPARTIYVGDTGGDMTTAVNSGITPVGVLWGFREAQELTEHGAEHLCSTVADLEKLIFSL